jgi:hypothetical protein
MPEASKLIVVLVVVLSLCCPFGATPGVDRSGTQITPSDKALEKMLDSTRVEELWLAGHHVNWKTGLPDGRPYLKKGAHTHCSAFVAAVAYRLGIYILRPPEHSQVHLANAQVDWLQKEGPAQGWQMVESGQEAQKLANEGFLVVAAYKTRNPEISGHIVVVRPGVKRKEMLKKEGPQVIQASTDNFSSATLQRAFTHHPGAFERGRIVFFAHAVPQERLDKFR